MHIRFLAGFVLLAVLLVTYPAWRWFREGREPVAPAVAASSSEREVPSESRPPALYMSISMDVEGISNPPLFTAKEVELADNEAVIGVESGGEARA